MTTTISEKYAAKVYKVEYYINEYPKAKKNKRYEINVVSYLSFNGIDNNSLYRGVPIRCSKWELKNRIKLLEKFYLDRGLFFLRNQSLRERFEDAYKYY